VTVILDAGALLAIERRNSRFLAHLREAQRRKVPVRTSSAVVAQVWRGGPKQAELARQLPAIDQRPLGDDAARAIGALLGSSRTSDVVDGHIALLCAVRDAVFTSDPDDIEHLLDTRGVAAVVKRV
jgi:hypothetical protein